MSAAQARANGLDVPRKPREKVVLRGPHVDFLELTLPWPPLANNLTTVARGRKVLSQDGRDYHETVRAACVNLGHLEGLLFCSLEIYPPHNRRYDAINVEKAITDGLVRCGTFRDDSDICEWRLSKRPMREPGSIRVVLWELSEDERCSTSVETG